jgi:hypothetical protein
VKGEWWLEATAVRTDQDGSFVLDGFLGDYLVAGDGVEGEVALAADAPRSSVRLGATAA